MNKSTFAVSGYSYRYFGYYITFNDISSIDKYRDISDTDEHWELKKNFMLAHRKHYTVNKLVCLTQIFSNIINLECTYPAHIMSLVERMTRSVFTDKHAKQKNRFYRLLCDVLKSSETQGQTDASKDNTTREFEVSPNSRIAYEESSRFRQYRNYSSFLEEESEDRNLDEYMSSNRDSQIMEDNSHKNFSPVKENNQNSVLDEALMSVYGLSYLHDEDDEDEDEDDDLTTNLKSCSTSQLGEGSNSVDDKDNISKSNCFFHSYKDVEEDSSVPDYDERKSFRMHDRNQSQSLVSDYDTRKSTRMHDKDSESTNKSKYGKSKASHVEDCQNISSRKEHKDSTTIECKDLDKIVNESLEPNSHGKKLNEEDVKNLIISYAMQWMQENNILIKDEDSPKLECGERVNELSDSNSDRNKSKKLDDYKKGSRKYDRDTSKLEHGKKRDRAKRSPETNHDRKKSKKLYDDTDNYRKSSSLQDDKSSVSRHDRRTSRRSSDRSTRRKQRRDSLSSLKDRHRGRVHRSPVSKYDKSSRLHDKGHKSDRKYSRRYSGSDSDHDEKTSRKKRLNNDSDSYQNIYRHIQNEKAPEKSFPPSMYHYDQVNFPTPFSTLSESGMSQATLGSGFWTTMAGELTNYHAQESGWVGFDSSMTFPQPIPISNQQKNNPNLIEIVCENEANGQHNTESSKIRPSFIHTGTNIQGYPLPCNPTITSSSVLPQGISSQATTGVPFNSVPQMQRTMANDQAYSNAPSMASYAPLMSSYAPSMSSYAPSRSSYGPSMSSYGPSMSANAPPMFSNFIPQVQRTCDQFPSSFTPQMQGPSVQDNSSFIPQLPPKSGSGQVNVNEVPHLMRMIASGQMPLGFVPQMQSMIASGQVPLNYVSQLLLMAFASGHIPLNFNPPIQGMIPGGGVPSGFMPRTMSSHIPPGSISQTKRTGKVSSIPVAQGQKKNANNKVSSSKSTVSVTKGNASSSESTASVSGKNAASSSKSTASVSCDNAAPSTKPTVSVQPYTSKRKLSNELVKAPECIITLDDDASSTKISKPDAEEKLPENEDWKIGLPQESIKFYMESKIRPCLKSLEEITLEDIRQRTGPLRSVVILCLKDEHEAKTLKRLNLMMSDIKLEVKSTFVEKKKTPQALMQRSWNCCIEAHHTKNNHIQVICEAKAQIKSQAVKAVSSRVLWYLQHIYFTFYINQNNHLEPSDLRSDDYTFMKFCQNGIKNTMPADFLNSCLEVAYTSDNDIETYSAAMEDYAKSTPASAETSSFLHFSKKISHTTVSDLMKLANKLGLQVRWKVDQYSGLVVYRMTTKMYWDFVKDIIDKRGSNQKTYMVEIKKPSETSTSYAHPYATFSK